jgi:TonB family protein
VKRCFGLYLFLLLFAGLQLWAQESGQRIDNSAIPSDGPSPMEGRVPNTSGFTVLSKATPDELKNYPFRILAVVRNHWFPQLRELRSSPGWKTGTSVIEFEINRDGTLGELRTAESSGSAGLDGAAAQAVTASSPFPPLPGTYPQNSLRLRYRFGYEQPASADAPLCNGPNWGAHSNAMQLTKVESGITAPHPLSNRDPEYSDEARKIRYQSRIRLAGTVDTNGDFTDLCILVPAGAGLDEQAMTAVKAWRFEPATVNGSATPVRIHVEVDFRLY